MSDGPRLSIRCLGCGRTDFVVGLMTDPPELRPGVFFSCVECGRLMVLSDELTWREAEAREIIAFARWLDAAKAARDGETLEPGMFGGPGEMMRSRTERARS